MDKKKCFLILTFFLSPPHDCCSLTTTSFSEHSLDSVVHSIDGLEKKLENYRLKLLINKGQGFTSAVRHEDSY